MPVLEWLSQRTLGEVSTAISLLIGGLNLFAWRSTRKMSKELHEWARERRREELASARRAAERERVLLEMKDRVESSDGPVVIPSAFDGDMLTEGQRRGLFEPIETADGFVRRVGKSRIRREQP